jgi:hypothetical protein
MNCSYYTCSSASCSAYHTYQDSCVCTGASCGVGKCCCSDGSCSGTCCSI